MPAGPVPDAVRLHARVRGLVQAVGFREFTRRHAVSLGLRGWVRNQPDGTVELVAEGPRDVVEELLARVRRGPRCSRVDAVEAEWGTGSGKEPSFTIR